MDIATMNLRGNKVDSMSTKDIDMKQRRIVDAAPAQDKNDYVIFDQLNQAVDQTSKDLTNAFVTLLISFKTTWIYITKLVTSVIRPAVDSTNAIIFTKADGKTAVATYDTTNSRYGVVGGIYSTQGDHNTLPSIAFMRMQYDPTAWNNYYGDLVSYDPVGAVYMPMAIRASVLTLGGFPGCSIAFFTDDQTKAVVKQILNSYSSNVQGSGYSGLATGLGGSPYAGVNDLNNLRAAYENLRLMCEDLRAKLRTSTLVG